VPLEALKYDFVWEASKPLHERRRVERSEREAALVRLKADFGEKDSPKKNASCLTFIRNAVVL
jgi:hypothetical protein